jgi:hypothetical protein
VLTQELNEPNMPVTKPLIVRKAPQAPGGMHIEVLLRIAAYMLQKYGCCQFASETMTGIGSSAISAIISEYDNPKKRTQTCLDSEELRDFLAAAGLDVAEAIKLLAHAQMPGSNPVTGMGFAGSEWMTTMSKLLAAKGTQGLVQMYTESGLHKLAKFVDLVPPHCRMIVTSESTVGTTTVQKNNLHTDSSLDRVEPYRQAYTDLAREKGWPIEESIIPAGQIQMCTNLGAPVDPMHSNWFAVIDPNTCEVPMDYVIPQKKRKLSGAQVPHWRKGDDILTADGIEFVEKNAIHYYSTGGHGDCFMWAATAPGSEQPGAYGLHAGVAPLCGKRPTIPRLGVISGCQTMPTAYILQNIEPVVRTVYEWVIGARGCHTFLQAAKRPVGFENHFGVKDHIGTLSKEQVKWLRTVRVADATEPGDGTTWKFRQGIEMTLKEFAEQHTSDVRNYIETLVAPEHLSEALKRALKICIHGF